MIRLNAPIVVPLLLLNIIGICAIFILESDNNDYGSRTLQENYLEYYPHTNLRGSHLKIKINWKSNINTKKNKNEFIEKEKESHLRKLEQENYGMYINIVPSVFCLIILFSFCVGERPNCSPNFFENNDDYYYENDYHSHHSHHDHHSHHSHHHHKEEKKDDKNDAAAALLICLLILVIIALVYIIPRAFGKYMARIVSLVTLCISYGAMIAFYAMKLGDDNYENVFYLFGISIALFFFNLLGLIVPLIIGCCRRNKDYKGEINNLKPMNNYY